MCAPFRSWTLRIARVNTCIRACTVHYSIILKILFILTTGARAESAFGLCFVPEHFVQSSKSDLLITHVLQLDYESFNQYFYAILLRNAIDISCHPILSIIHSLIFGAFKFLLRIVYLLSHCSKNENVRSILELNYDIMKNIRLTSIACIQLI